jgi:hypothetical protein
MKLSLTTRVERLRSVADEQVLVGPRDSEIAAMRLSQSPHSHIDVRCGIKREDTPHLLCKLEVFGQRYPFGSVLERCARLLHLVLPVERLHVSTASDVVVQHASDTSDFVRDIRDVVLRCHVRLHGLDTRLHVPERVQDLGSLRVRSFPRRRDLVDNRPLGDAHWPLARVARHLVVA